MRRGIIVVVSGFSGSGKGTIMKRLLQDYDSYSLSISMTTRQPRPGEVNGREYFFVDEETFKKEIAQDGLIECTYYCDHYYGTPRKFVEEQLDAGKNIILEIEVDGALQIKEKFPDTLLIFISAPSVPQLKERLMNRSSETEEEIALRLKRAAKEAVFITDYDFIIVNDDLDKCVRDVHEAIEASHMTPPRNTEFIDRIKKELSAYSSSED